MPGSGQLAALLVPLNDTSPDPLHRQVYLGVRDAILSGRLSAGVRIPSTRHLAKYLGVSRSTILLAFQQLVAEGYIVATVGSGSFVARPIPGHLLRNRRESPVPAPSTPWVGRVATRVARVQELRRRATQSYPGAFWTGVPPVDEFPLSTWSRLAARRYRRLGTPQLYHGPAVGYQPLRDAIVAHLASARGVQALPDQVLVLSSAQEALELTCRVLLDPDDPVWIEEPSWSGALGALISAGARILHVPVDAEGLVVEQGIRAEPRPRLVYVTPSHQYPTGVTMSLERRLTLLDWAARNGIWIVEDDYDSEYRHAGRPLTALQGLDSAQRVIYIGTFNKTLFPALRIGYVVVPDGLFKDFRVARSIGSQHTPTIDQMILADFMTEGHYARHMRRMRVICQERRDVLVGAAEREMGDWLRFTQAETGLHAVAWLSEGISDVEVSAAADRLGVEAAPLSGFYAGPRSGSGLVLGYGGLTPPEIRLGVRKLADAIHSVSSAEAKPSSSRHS